MRHCGLALCAAALLSTTGTAGAAPKPISVDRSGSTLIDAATSERLWQENTPARVLKLYPSRKFRFVSEVSGGFNAARTCVVSARALLLPVVMLPVQGSKLVYAPVRSAAAFDAAPSLSEAQCRELAHDKLKEAIQSLTSALAAS